MVNLSLLQYCCKNDVCVPLWGTGAAVAPTTMAVAAVATMVAATYAVSYRVFAPPTIVVGWLATSLNAEARMTLFCFCHRSLIRSFGRSFVRLCPSTNVGRVAKRSEAACTHMKSSSDTAAQRWITTCSPACRQPFRSASGRVHAVLMMFLYFPLKTNAIILRLLKCVFESGWALGALQRFMYEA